MPKNINLIKGRYYGKTCVLIGRGKSCRPVLKFKPNIFVAMVNSRPPHRPASFNFYMDKAYEKYACPEHTQFTTEELASPIADYTFPGGAYNGASSAALSILSNTMGFTTIFLYGFECFISDGVTHSDTGETIEGYNFQGIIDGINSLSYDANILNVSLGDKLKFPKIDDSDPILKTILDFS